MLLVKALQSPCSAPPASRAAAPVSDQLRNMCSLGLGGSGDQESITAEGGRAVPALVPLGSHPQQHHMVRLQSDFGQKAPKRGKYFPARGASFPQLSGLGGCTITCLPGCAGADENHTPCAKELLGVLYSLGAPQGSQLCVFGQAEGFGVFGS